MTPSNVHFYSNNRMLLVNSEDSIDRGHPTSTRTTVESQQGAGVLVYSGYCSTIYSTYLYLLDRCLYYSYDYQVTYKNLVQVRTTILVTDPITHPMCLTSRGS